MLAKTKARSRRIDDRRQAVIDIGSNSIRLVVYQGRGRAPLQLFNEKVMCGLGRGVAATGLLAADGVAMALSNLGRFHTLLAAMSVDEPVQVLATAAVREARNGPEFVNEVQRRFGFKVRILSGVEEARLSALGVMSAIPSANGLIGDLGGGSLELVEVADGAVGPHTTLPLGPLRLMDETGGNLRKARGVIDKALAEVPWVEQLKGRNFYAVGGAWRMLARLLMDDQQYPLRVIHQYSLPEPVVRQFLDRFQRLSKDDLKRMPSLSRRRLDTLPWAALILSRLFAVAPPRELVFSAYGLREGSLFDRLKGPIRTADPLIEACVAIGHGGRFNLSPEELFDFVRPVLPLQDEGLLRLSRAVCTLSDIAWTEHPDYRADHAYQRVLRLPVVGVDHPGRAFMALAMAARHGADLEHMIGTVANQLIDPTTARIAGTLGIALRLAYALSGGAPDLLAQAKLVLRDGGVILTLTPGSASAVGDAVFRRLDALGRVLSLVPRIQSGEAEAAA